MQPVYSCCRRAAARHASLASQLDLASIVARSTTSAPAAVHQIQARQYHASSRCAYASSAPSKELHSPHATTVPMASTSTAPPSMPSGGALRHEPNAENVASHINALAGNLHPPISNALALRMVTHKGSVSSGPQSSMMQHNGKLSLIGRRVMRLYLSIFLHAHKSTTSKHSASSSELNMNDLVERLLHTQTLGRYISPEWELEEHMHWRQVRGPDGRPSGLQKVSGTAVEAIIGGLYHQYGAAVALQAFNSRILALLPLPDELKDPAIQLARQHGDLSQAPRSDISSRNKQ